ncbi:hypothetical protein ADK52_09260 [Streptomyces sp. WM6372]|nr:hypothetical protein ADK52_09260 [Streptomyces sp. WM6372]
MLHRRVDTNTNSTPTSTIRSRGDPSTSMDTVYQRPGAAEPGTTAAPRTAFHRAPTRNGLLRPQEG